MKHTIPELIEVARRLFPEGCWPEGYEASDEHRRRMEAHAQARTQYETWRSMLRRLRERFPRESFPGVHVTNESLRLEAPDAAPIDRCLSGSLELPPRTEHEINHRLGFRVSVVVPYYFVYSIHQVTEPLDFDHRTSFDFSADEEALAAAVEDEIRKSFPSHTRMTPDVGMTIVPDVATICRIPGEARLYDCLFSDYW